MNHLGDVSKINGRTVPAVDCIAFGSPCQDLSVAGKRAGLEGERSGLFMEAVRIFKEMRSNERAEGLEDDRADEPVRHHLRYTIWENVKGAMSSPGGSRKGEDFRCVLEELARVSEADYRVPMPERGCWPHSGILIGSDPLHPWSIAWRLFDAQYFGVPQRRSRIAVLCDYDGYTAPDILLTESVRVACSADSDTSEMGAGHGRSCEVRPFLESSHGNIEPVIAPWEGIARNPEDRAGMDCKTIQVRCGCDGGGKGALIQDDMSATLSTVQSQTVF